MVKFCRKNKTKDLDLIENGCVFFTIFQTSNPIRLRPADLVLDLSRTNKAFVVIFSQLAIILF